MNNQTNNQINLSCKKIENYIYKLTDIIGKGYSSTVFKGINQKNGQNVAIKVIEFKKLTQAHQQLLQNQINILKKVNHPNIIKCYDIYSTVNNCYIITQLCDTDLQRILKEKKLTVIQAVKYFKQIFSGVQQLIKKNIVHRDIKPANIFLKQNVPKLADFGFAKFNIKSQKAKFNVGSPMYMPLQSLENNIYSQKSDIWALGILFYELINGEAPWKATFQSELIMKINNHPMFFRVNVPQQISSFLKFILTRQEQKRPTINQLKNHKFWSFTIKNTQSKLLRKNTIQDHRQIKKQLSCSIRIKNKQNNKVQVNHQKFHNINHGIKVFIQQINYCRFLYRIYDKCKKFNYVCPKSIPGLILKRINQLKQMCNGGPNFIKLQNWNMIINCPQFQMHYNMANQYHKRYERNVKDQGFESIQRQQQQILEFLKSYGEIINKSLLFKQQLTNVMIQQIELIWKVQRLYKLNKIWLQNPQGYQIWAEKSNILWHLDHKNWQINKANLNTIYKQIKELNIL